MHKTTRSLLLLALLAGLATPVAAQTRTRVPLESPRIEPSGRGARQAPSGFGEEEVLSPGEPAPGETAEERARGLFRKLAEAYRREDPDAVLDLFEPSDPGFPRLKRSVEQFLADANYFAMDFAPQDVAERDNRAEGEVLVGMRLRPKDLADDLYLRDRIRVVVARREGKDRFLVYRVRPVRYASYDNPVRPERYDLGVRLHPAEGSIEVEGTVVLRNRGSEPVAGFALNLLPLVESFQARDLRGQDLPVRAEAGRTFYAEIDLRESVPPGERLSLAFSYTMRFVGRTPEIHVGPEDVYLIDRVAWYPFFAPVADPFEPTFDFDLRLDAPEDLTVLSAGHADPPSADGTGRRTWHFWSTGRTSEIPLVAGRYVTRVVKVGKGMAPVTILGFPGRPAGGADAAAELLGKVLDWLEERLGSVPAGGFTVVTIRRSGYYAWGSVVALGGEFAEERRGLLADPGYFVNWLTHQACHAWFVDGIRPQGAGEYFLREGFCNYFGVDILDDLVRKGMRSELLRNRQEVFRNGLPADRPLAEVTAVTEESDLLISDKAEIVVAMLEKWMGEDSFRKGLQTFLGRFRGKPAGLQDLENVLCEADPQVRVFFGDWIFGKNVADPSPVSVESTPLGNGMYRTRMVVRNEGGGHLAVPIDFYTGLRWAAGAEVRLGPGEEAPVEVETMGAVTFAEVDPSADVLQANTRNDLWPDASAYKRRRFPPRKVTDLPGRERPEAPPASVIPAPR